jgi:hypothetical protein
LGRLDAFSANVSDVHYQVNAGRQLRLAPNAR